MKLPTSPNARVKITAMNTDDKIGRAKTKTQAATYHLDEVIRIHENNAFAIYSKTIVGQIPRSLAALAFETLQNTLFHYELVSICRLWDSCDPDKENIPTIARLIEGEDAIQKLVQAERSNWPNEQNFANEQAIKLETKIRHTLASIKAIENGPELESIMNLRDKHLAHSLERTRREKNGTIVNPLKYGDETKILESTIPIVRDLHLAINGSHYSIEETRAQTRKHSEAFWIGITVSVLG